ncbi:MAG TPA: hypothetical protein VLF68_00070 [Candidatus Saccharimonadales bacterium]|nr:hypothetical protein [Candidatus Saccharimonadales bacterium]
MQKNHSGIIKRFTSRLHLGINKRQQFIIAVLVSSLGLFLSENIFSKAGVTIAIVLSFVTDFFLYLSLKEDLEDNFFPQIFILPFFYSLSFGLFYFLVPARLLTKIIMTTLYAIGLYSVYLSQNIFTVSSIRTIALLAGARTVSLVITMLSFFFLTDVLLSLHLHVVLTFFLLSLFSFPLILHSIWTYTLSRSLKAETLWVVSLTLCITEIAVVLWFWPSTPTVLALFLSGIFYIIISLSHVWLERRLFKSVIWEYLWVSLIIFIVLFLFTNWS